MISSLGLFSCQSKNSSNKELGKNDKKHQCTHCGMPTQEFPKWQSSLTTHRGEHRTCSPRCMFFSVLEGEVKDIKSIKVKEYYEQKDLDAKKAFYVIGSDIIGPMGKDFVPFATKADAEEFMLDHKGRKILTFEQISLKTIEEVIQN